MSDRIDDLLDAYIESGELPANTTDAERAEVERLARASGLLRATRDITAGEANAAMPIARARFERFVVAAEAAVPEAVAAPKESRRSWFARLYATHRGLQLTGLATAIGVLMLVVLFAAQNARDTTESALAQVLDEGDYAQVYGTVSSVSGEGDSRTFFVSSEYGDLEVAADSGTSVVESNELHDLASIQPGTNLLIAGLVGRDRIILAQTLAFAGAESTPVAEARTTAAELTRTPPDSFMGKIGLMTLAEDGLGAKVVVLADDRTRYVVRISRANAGLLIAGANRILGADVTLTRATESGERFYIARLAGSDSTPGRGTPTPEAPEDETTTAAEATRRTNAATATPDSANGFSRMEGVIVSRDGNVLVVQTAAGNVRVVIRTQTQIILDEAGISVADFRRGETVIGHTLVVQGGIERVTGRFIADVVLVGPKP